MPIFIALPCALVAATESVRARGWWTDAPDRAGRKTGVLVGRVLGLIVAAVLLALVG